MQISSALPFFFVGTTLMIEVGIASAQGTNRLWMNAQLSPEDRAELVVKELSLNEKLALVHGNGMAGEPRWQMPHTRLANGGAGYTQGVGRLGIPPLIISDAAYGARASGANGRYASAMPSNLAAASSWDEESACQFGEVIGSELRAQGFDMTLAGGVNLTREPRNGRTFEYAGEDPLVAGTVVGNMMKCEQGRHVIGDIKHYAVNDQETGRFVVNSVISKRAMQKSDLLAFSVDVSNKIVPFTVKNTGKRIGTEIAEVYATLPEGVDESFKRLAGWKRVTLAPGESQDVAVAIDSQVLQILEKQTTRGNWLTATMGPW